jgi:hypothetical protein
MLVNDLAVVFLIGVHLDKGSGTDRAGYLLRRQVEQYFRNAPESYEFFLAYIDLFILGEPMNEYCPIIFFKTNYGSTAATLPLTGKRNPFFQNMATEIRLKISAGNLLERVGKVGDRQAVPVGPFGKFFGH